jgi:hypothetical protein
MTEKTKTLFPGLETLTSAWMTALLPTAAGGGPMELATRLLDPASCWVSAVLRWSGRETYADFITALQAAAVEGKPARSGRELLDRWTARLWPRPAASFGSIAASGFSRSARKVFEQALVAHWQSVGLLEAPTAAFRAEAAERIVCVSGSCSSVTAAQIAHAERHGFAAIRLDATRAVDGPGRERELGRTVELALGAFGEGRDPLVFTARGPDDPAVLEGIELALKGGQVGRPDFFLAAKAGGP